MSRGIQEKQDNVDRGQAIEPWFARAFEVFFLKTTGVETRVVKDSADYASIDFMVYQGDEMTAWVEVTRREKKKYTHEYFKKNQAARYAEKVEEARKRDLPCYLVQFTSDFVFLLYDLKNPSTDKPFRIYTYDGREEQWVHGWDYNTLLYKFVIRDDEGRLNVGDNAKSNPVIKIFNGPGTDIRDYHSYPISTKSRDGVPQDANSACSN